MTSGFEAQALEVELPFIEMGRAVREAERERQRERERARSLFGICEVEMLMRQSGGVWS